MTSTLTPACPLCGLRYESKPLLELHVREDHRQRRRAQPGRRDRAGTGASPPSGSPSHRSGRDSRPSGTVKEVTAMTADRAGSVMTAARQVIRALRHADAELLRVGEAIIRSARAPRLRPQSQARVAGPAQRDTATERADRAA
jgi:NaMN:DMB phosphoribosyltransferase